MEIRNVTTFVRIVETGSFTKAAESLGYSQAAVTAQIKSMEDELGVPLFDKVGKRVYLTLEGKTFLPHAINMLKAEEEAVSSVKMQEDLTGELTLCADLSPAMRVLPELLLEFHKLHPNVKVTLNASDYLDDKMQRLRNGEIDILIALDEKDPHPELLTVAERRENVVFVTWPGNPLLKKKKVGLADLVHNDFIVTGRGRSYSGMLEKGLKARGISFDPAMDIGSVGAIIDILRGGYGISFIPEFTVRDHIKRGELAVLTPSEDLPTNLFTTFLCNPDRWINPVMREFIRIANQ
jgi:DNA-binding transcriptional LysR family regulator